MDKIGWEFCHVLNKLLQIWKTKDFNIKQFCSFYLFVLDTSPILYRSFPMKWSISASSFLWCHVLDMYFHNSHLSFVEKNSLFVHTNLALFHTPVLWIDKTLPARSDRPIKLHVSQHTYNSENDCRVPVRDDGHKVNGWNVLGPSNAFIICNDCIAKIITEGGGDK